MILWRLKTVEPRSKQRVLEGTRVHLRPKSFGFQRRAKGVGEVNGSYPFRENAFAVHFGIQVLKLHPRATSGIIVLPPNGRMHVLQESSVYHLRRFPTVFSIQYTRMHQKTALLIYTRQETDCAYCKKPYTVHRRGESPRFAVCVQGFA